MATDRVSIGQMADAIMEGLEEYASLATDDLKAVSYTHLTLPTN